MDDTATLFELLAADLRRRILFALCDEDSITVPEGVLQRGQAQPCDPQDADSNSPPGHFSSPAPEEDMHELTLKLEHMHLPKLDDAGLIKWQRDTDTITRGPRFEEVEPVLRLLAANQHRFPDDLL